MWKWWCDLVDNKLFNDKPTFFGIQGVSAALVGQQFDFHLIDGKTICGEMLGANRWWVFLQTKRGMISISIEKIIWYRPAESDSEKE